MRSSFGTYSALRVFLCTTLIVGASSCVKMARRAHHAEGQSVRPLVRSEAAGSARLVDLNTATRHELEKLPGIGEGLAARIIEHRKRHGPFRRAEHLIMVRGISDRRFRQLRPFVKVE